MEITTLAEAFAFFDTYPDNSRWSWSAVSEDRLKVAVTIWENEMGTDGTFDLFGHPRLADWTSKPGNRERIRNLKIARDACGGLFHVIWVTARDLNETPWTIAGRYPEEHLMMKLTALDEATGEFSAVLVDPTTSQLEQRTMRERPIQPPVYKTPTVKLQAPVKVCPTCYMAVPATGVCDNCD